jgi:ML-like domain
MEGSSFAASRFRVAFTPDNETLTFDIKGNSEHTANIVLDIEVLGYGYSVAHPIINPCETKELIGLCPLNSGPLEIEGNAPVPKDAVKQIPSMYLEAKTVEWFANECSSNLLRTRH